MAMNAGSLITRFEKIIGKFIGEYRGLPDGYFFTEKELHSYFYHLCLSDSSFSHSDYNLVHAEYPTPFKCSFKGKDNNIIRGIDSKHRRAHIDLVLLNPKFIDWLESVQRKYESLDYVKGLTNASFSDYIKELISKYEQFSTETGGSVLLYALEFKYFRTSYEGKKNPRILIDQDIKKLTAFRSFKLNFQEKALLFSRKVKLLVFVGEKATSVLENSEEFCKKNHAIVRMVSKEVP